MSLLDNPTARERLRNPRLVDTTITLIHARGLTAIDLARRYGIAPSWLPDMTRNPHRSPSTDLIQLIYEDLTGTVLVQLPNYD